MRRRARRVRDSVQGVASGALIAAGLSVPIPSGQNWKILGVTVRISTSGGAGNRRVTIELLDTDDSVLMVVATGQVVTASTVTSINFAVGGYPVAAAGTSPLASVWDAWPVCSALAGQRLRITDQAGIDITDTATVLVSAESEPTG